MGRREKEGVNNHRWILRAVLRNETRVSEPEEHGCEAVYYYVGDSTQRFIFGLWILTLQGPDGQPPDSPARGCNHAHASHQTQLAPLRLRCSSLLANHFVAARRKFQLRGTLNSNVTQGYIPTRVANFRFYRWCKSSTSLSIALTRHLLISYSRRDNLHSMSKENISRLIN